MPPFDSLIDSRVFPDEERLSVIVRNLPAAPRILAELAPHLQLMDSTVADVTSVLRRDTALTARLIDMANSVMYAGREPATSVDEAVARIGYRETYRLVGAVATTQLADEPLEYYGIAAHRLRENALFVALMMEELAETIGFDSRTAYTVGLLRSTGMVVLNRCAREGGNVPTYDSVRFRLLAWERSLWNCTSADVGARVLEMWDFPDEASSALRDHYAAKSGDGLADLLHLAAATADVRGFGLPGERPYWRVEAMTDDESLMRAADRAYQTLARVSAMLW